jgi:hypothetical protein
MLFDGYMTIVDVGTDCSPDSSSAAKAEARAQASDQLVAVLTQPSSANGDRNVRVALTSDGLTMAVVANGPAHLLALLERYEKCCKLQLAAMRAAGMHGSDSDSSSPDLVAAAAAAKRVLRLIEPDVVQQPRNGFLCATTDPEPAGGQMQLEAYKRMAGW